MKKSSVFFTDASFIKPNQYCSVGCYALTTLSILFLVLLHASIVYFVVNINLDTNNIRIDKYIYKAFVIYSVVLIGFLFFYPVYVMAFVRPRRLLNYLKNGYQWHLFSKERLLFSYPVLAIIPLDFSIYTSFKNDIPIINPFWLDVPLYKIDRAIFWGSDPWQLFQHIISDPGITRVIDFLYHSVWLYFLIVIVLFHAFGRHSLDVRLRFFLSFIIVWAVLGNALATVLSSAGPCYFSQVTGQAIPYEELMGYLYSIKADGLVLLEAIKLQEWLWYNYTHSILREGSGISAMPSIHIASTALYALSMNKSNSITKALVYIYAFVIWIGSIHLGWHYATDGMVSFLCVMVIWYYSGKLTDKIIPKETKE